MDSQTSFSMPSPADTPYRTPSSSLSHRSRDYEDMSPSSTPPPLPTDVRIAKKRSNDSQKALDEGLSPLDPRRFTPTLHASLVSEILSLRRDIESKSRSIDQLEQSLDNAQSQNESLSKSLLASNKETRSVKRQMQLLEGGTLSALNELSKERDEAIHESVDLRHRFEQMQKRAKSHEDNASRTQILWDQEKESWAGEKRVLETKTHIAETRLKTVLEEVAQAQAAAQAHVKTTAVPGSEGIHSYENRESIPGSPQGLPSPTFQRRRLSTASTSSDFGGGRASALSFVNGHSTSLADELALGDIEEHSGDETEDEQGRFSPGALEEERTRPASSLSTKARKILGLAFDIETMRHEGTPLHGIETDTKPTDANTVQTAIYVDSAVQHSPPRSPSQELVPELHTNGPAMVSTSCQTVERLPSPPLTPKEDDTALETIPESAFERSETRDMCTQTDVRPRPGTSRYIHSRTSTHDLGIPTIAIIPPTSRPTTPETNVVLPPHTKNASCQVETTALSNYKSSSVQTEEIRVDRRNILTSHFKPTSTISSHIKATTKGKASAHSRRGHSQSIQPASNTSSKRTVVQNSSFASPNDNGPLSADSALASSRPVRSSSLFAGFDDYADEPVTGLDDDIFYEDEYASRPTAKFTLRSGKLVSQEGTISDTGGNHAASAGEAVALDNLKRSESTLPPELRQFDPPERSKGSQRPNAVKRVSSGTKQANVRRAVLISSGVAAHQSKHSQSTIESGSNEGALPPPIPIPLRYSSARIGKSYSESGRTSRGSSNNTSPTRQYRQKYKPALRKARSGPAISPSAQTRRPRSKSPPLDSRVSIVPEMPVFHMPAQTPFDVPPPLLTNNAMSSSFESNAPRLVASTGLSRSQSHRKQISDPAVLPQTSVVDAIAQTMVGEWMYKYVRRRKSFGKIDKDWDPNKSVEELTSSPANAGARHKRWVWLAPYERAVMWSSKQPMNGTALLGKGGRKLTVKSVLDVKDDNPMPKNALSGPTFNRSILVLTPQRALKFTATSQERHFVWLTALSFLSHSPLSIGDLAALPPPPDEYRSPSPPPPQVGGSFRRRTIRDSIRIAKAPVKLPNGLRSVTDTSFPIEQLSSTRPSTREYHDHENDIALPPTIKRFHTRNRSNTAPRPQPTVMSFSQRDVEVTPSLHEPAAIDRFHYPPIIGNPSIPNSRRGSEASAFGRPALNSSYTNHIQPAGFSFSDSSHNASMTMRMDAFVDNKQTGKGNFRNLRLGGPSRATNKDLSYWGIEEAASPVSTIDSLTPATASFRLSESTGRGSVERDVFRGF